MPKSWRLVAVAWFQATLVLLMLGIVLAAPRGTVILDPLTATRSGLPGSTVTFTLWVTNTGGNPGVTDVFTLAHTGNMWPVTLSAVQLQLEGNAGASLVVSVTVPTVATATRDTVTVTVYSQGSPQSSPSRLTTMFYQVYLSSAIREYCPSIDFETYSSLAVEDYEPPQRPAELHGDLNLALRGYSPTSAWLGLVDIGGSDPKTPQLAGLFDVPHAPDFPAAYRVNNWDWGCNCRGDPIEEVEVSLIDLAVSSGEVIRVPDSGYDIGAGYRALVLYASPVRLTLKYTRNDSVWPGYSIHVENICVAPALLELYRTLDSAGRHQLPALRAGQAIGHAAGNRVGVAIRDGGSFLDPRWRYDWWRGY